MQMTWKKIQRPRVFVLVFPYWIAIHSKQQVNSVFTSMRNIRFNFTPYSSPSTTGAYIVKRFPTTPKGFGLYILYYLSFEEFNVMTQPRESLVRSKKLEPS